MSSLYKVWGVRIQPTSYGLRYVFFLLSSQFFIIFYQSWFYLYNRNKKKNDTVPFSRLFPSMGSPCWQCRFSRCCHPAYFCTPPSCSMIVSWLLQVILTSCRFWRLQNWRSVFHLRSRHITKVILLFSTTVTYFMYNWSFFLDDFCALLPFLKSFHGIIDMLWYKYLIFLCTPGVWLNVWTKIYIIIISKLVKSWNPLHTQSFFTCI